jgi:hypothetical protein
MSTLKHAQIGITSDCLVILSFFTLLVWPAPGRDGDARPGGSLWFQRAFRQDNYGRFWQ